MTTPHSEAPTPAPDVANATRAVARAAYVTPILRVHGDAAELTRRNWFAPGRQDGSSYFRRTG